jgi:hypothetical protein
MPRIQPRPYSWRIDTCHEGSPQTGDEWDPPKSMSGTVFLAFYISSYTLE